MYIQANNWLVIITLEECFRLTILCRPRNFRVTIVPVPWRFPALTNSGTHLQVPYNFTRTLEKLFVRKKTKKTKVFPFSRFKICSTSLVCLAARRHYNLNLFFSVRKLPILAKC